jgi:hypothetical protein
MQLCCPASALQACTNILAQSVPHRLFAGLLQKQVKVGDVSPAEMVMHAYGVQWLLPLRIQVDTPRVCNCPDDQRLVGLFVVYAYA